MTNEMTERNICGFRFGNQLCTAKPHNTNVGHWFIFSPPAPSNEAAIWTEGWNARAAVDHDNSASFANPYVTTVETPDPGHEHGDWDQGGYCNRLVMRNGYGDTCGYQKPVPLPETPDPEQVAAVAPPHRPHYWLYYLRQDDKQMNWEPVNGILPETPDPNQCSVCGAYNNRHYRDCVMVIDMTMPRISPDWCPDCGAHNDKHYSDCRRVLYEKRPTEKLHHVQCALPITHTGGCSAIPIRP